MHRMRDVKNRRHVAGSMVDRKSSCNDCKSVCSIKTYMRIWCQKYVSTR